MGNFNPLLRCMQLRRLLVSQQGGAMCCFSKLISGPYHHNNQVGAPSPSSNLISRLYHHNNQVGVPSPSSSSNVQTHLLPSLSPNNCYLFVHEPATCDLKDETPTYTGPDRLYSLGAAGALDISQNYKDNIDKGVEVLNNIVRNKNRLHVDLLDSACIGSSLGWLLFVNRTTLDLHLLNPFDANPHIIPLPTIKYPPFVFGPDEDKKISENEIVSVRKFVISSTPLIGSDNKCYNNDCIIMILCSNLRLAFCRLGGDKVWTALTCIGGEREHDDLYIDMVYSSKEKLFYLFPGFGIEAWDLHTDPSSPKLLFFREIQNFMSLFDFDPEDIYDDDRPIHTVDSHSGKLLILVWFADHSGDHMVGFDVFELDMDFEQNMYMHKPVKDLGDRALLLDHNQATFVSASQFPNILKPNSIYYIREGQNYAMDYHLMKWSANAGFAFTIGDKSPVKPLFPSITEIIPKNSASWLIPPHAIL